MDKLEFKEVYFMEDLDEIADYISQCLITKAKVADDITYLTDKLYKRGYIWREKDGDIPYNVEIVDLEKYHKEKLKEIQNLRKEGRVKNESTKS